jgi:hypothetical protein
MKLPVSAAELKKMKLLSRGNPKKIAEYTLKEKQYKEMVSAFFDDETPFASHPSESYVESLRRKAEETGDEADKARYAIMKDRFDMNEYEHKQAHFDYVKTRSTLIQKVSAGEKLTKSDLHDAELLARQSPGPENMVLYSKIKRELSQEASE